MNCSKLGCTFPFVTALKKPGLVCSKCKVLQILKTCANLPEGHEIWTCLRCETISKNTRRTSIQPRTSLSGSQPSSSLPGQTISHRKVSQAPTNTNTIQVLMSEFNELKNINKQRLSKLSLITDVMTMVNELRDEVNQLKITNKHMHAENTALKEDLRHFKIVNTTMTPAPMPTILYF